MSRALIAFLAMAMPHACAYAIARPTDGSCPAGGRALAHGAASAQVPVDDLLDLVQVHAHTQKRARGARGSPRSVSLATQHAAENQDCPCGARQQGNATTKPLVYVHFHKAGGSTMCQLARDNGEVTSGSACSRPEFDAYQWYYRTAGYKPYSCADRCAYTKMTNITFSTIEREFKDTDYCPDMFEYAASVRDPIDLMESFLNFVTRQPVDAIDPWERHDVEDLKSSMIACLLDDDANRCQNPAVPTQVQTYFVHFDNFMVRVLGGPEVMQLPPKAVNATHLKKALDLLASFVTVLRYEDILGAGNTAPLRQAFGWNEFSSLQTPPTRVWGVPWSPEHACQFSEKEKAGLRVVNKYDYELYNWVKPS